MPAFSNVQIMTFSVSTFSGRDVWATNSGGNVLPFSTLPKTNIQFQWDLNHWPQVMQLVQEALRKPVSCMR